MKWSHTPTTKEKNKKKFIFTLGLNIWFMARLSRIEWNNNLIHALGKSYPDFFSFHFICLNSKPNAILTKCLTCLLFFSFFQKQEKTKTKSAWEICEQKEHTLLLREKKSNYSTFVLVCFCCCNEHNDQTQLGLLGLQVTAHHQGKPRQKLKTRT